MRIAKTIDQRNTKARDDIARAWYAALDVILSWQDPYEGWRELAPWLDYDSPSLLPVDDDCEDESEL